MSSVTRATHSNFVFFSVVILHRLNLKTSTTTTASTATILRSYDYVYTWHKHYVNLYLYICVGFSTINKQSHWNQLRHCCHRFVELLSFFFWLIIRRLCATTGWKSGKQLVVAGEWECEWASERRKSTKM